MQSSKRDFLRTAVASAATVMLGSTANAQAPAPKPPGRPTPDEALKLLVEGNASFAEGKGSFSCRTPSDFASLAAAQYPFAVIVACADSRVGPEIMFDRGLGDLFVVRVAGNVVAGASPSVKGSIEYAVAELGAPLIVVLGHSNCGAVKAAIQHIDQRDSLPGAIGGLVELIKPAVQQVRGETGDALLAGATRANVQRGVARLRTLEPIVARSVKSGKVKVVGGVYDLATGRVTWAA
jgi:carbonic anhydrase